MLIIKNKKAGMGLSIVLLVLATLILTAFALYTFYTKQSLIEEKIYATRFLEDMYSKEAQINFYIDNILEEAAESSEGREGGLVDNFKTELDLYKGAGGSFIISELGQIAEQADESHIKIEDGIATADFEITLRGKVEINNKESFSAVYTYNKLFEKKLETFKN